MKKFLMLFLGLTLMASCSSDDDQSVTETDPIVGTWMLTEANTDLINPQACDETSTLTFNENNSGNGTFYLATSNCEPQSSSANWENISDSVYSIELPIPLIGRQEGTVEFQNNNNMFQFSPNGIPGLTLTFERIEE